MRRSGVRLTWNRLRTLTLVTLLGVVASACVGGGEDPLELGLKRVALDLAFKDAELTPDPPPPKVITKIIEIDEDVYDALPTEPVRRIPDRDLPSRFEEETCAVAEPNATIQDTAFHELKVYPAEGAYPRHNEGTVNVTIGASAGDAPSLSFDLPYPRRSVWEVRNISTSQNSTYLRPEQQDDVRPRLPEGTAKNSTTAWPHRVYFDLVRNIGTGRTQTVETTTYMIRGEITNPLGATDMHLLRRETVRPDAEPEVFEPSPPIKVLDLNMVQSEEQANNVGIDRDRNKAMKIDYQIANREYIDVCGEFFDTFVVTFQEQMIDLSTDPPQTSGTEEEGDVIKWNVIFDHPTSGLLIVREEGHFIRRTSTRTTVNGQEAIVPLELRYDYVTTLDDARNVPVPFESVESTESR